MSKSIQQSLRTSFRSTPDTNVERRTADVFLASNNTFEMLGSKEVEIYYQTPEEVVMAIDNRVFTVFKEKNDKLWYTRPKYTVTDSYLLPAILGYSAFSTFYNLQLLFNIEQLVTISNLFLMLVIVFMSWILGKTRAEQKVDILFLKRYKRAFKSIELSQTQIREITTIHTVYRGFTWTHIFSAMSIGFLGLFPIAFSPYLDTVDYFLGYLSVAIMLAFLTGRLVIGRSSHEMLHENQPRIYGPNVVEPVMTEAENIVGFENIGTLVNLQELPHLEFEGEFKQLKRSKYGILIDTSDLDDTALRERIKKYKNMVITGIREVYRTSNALDNDEETFQTFLSETYKEHDISKEQEFTIVSSEQAKEVLNETLTDADQLGTILQKNLSALDAETATDEERPIRNTFRELLLAYDIIARRVQNALAYVVQENKTYSEMSASDKAKIGHLGAALSYEKAANSKPPSIEKPVEWTSVIKIGMIAASLILLLFVLVWMEQFGLLS